MGALYCGNLTIKNCFSAAAINGNQTRMILGLKCSDYTNSYSIQNSYRTGSDNFGGYAADLDNLKNESWITSNLGWNFNSVWTFDDSNGYEYPVLRGFDGMGGIQIPEIPEIPEIPDIPELSE